MARALQVQIVGDASRLKKAFDDSGGFASKFGNVIKRTGQVLGAAIVGGAVVSIKAFADFDAAMTQSTAIMGDLSDTMRKDMADAAREVAKTTTFSAKEAAESYFFLASAGLDAEASIAALPVVAKFAQAGMFDMARATDLATDAQSALGLASDDAQENLKNLTRVTDVLVKANTLANASVEQFSESLTQKAGAALRSVNKDIEEGVAVLAVFADQGIKGSEAGTALNATLIGLTDGARKNAAAFERLNVQVFDSDGAMRNMADIVGDLEVALGGMSVEQQRAELAAMGFNRQALNGILALMGNSEALREYEGELRNAAGTVDEIAEKQLQTFWAQLGLLKDQVMDLAIEVGSHLVPHLMTFVQFLQDKMPAVQELAGSVMEAIRALFGSTAEDVREATDGWAAGIDSTVEVMDGWAARVAPGAGETRGVLAAVAGFITGTVVPAFATIRAWWDRNWPRIEAVLELFKEKFREIVTAIKGFIHELKVDFAALRDALEDDTSDVSQSVQRMRDNWQGATEAIERLINTLRETFGFNSREMQGEMGRLEAAVKGLSDGLAIIFKAIEIAVEALRITWNTIFGDMIRLIREWVEFVGEARTMAVEAFETLRDGIKAALEALPEWFRSLGGNMISALIAGITGRAGDVVRALTGVVSGAVNAAKRALGISSPSRVFMEIGRQVNEGLLAGLQRDADAIHRQMLRNVTPPAVSRLRVPAGSVRGGDIGRMVNGPLVHIEHADFHEDTDADLVARRLGFAARGVFG